MTSYYYGSIIYIKGEIAMSLQSERKKRKISTADIAYLTGVSRRTIEAYESGARDIKKASYETLDKIANLLNVPIEKLVEKEG